MGGSDRQHDVESSSGVLLSCDAGSGERDVDTLEASDHEGGDPVRFLDELEVRAAPDECAQARLELDAREWGSDADVDPAAEADVLCGIPGYARRLTHRAPA